MAYDINKTDGSLLVTVQDGSIESSASSIKLESFNQYLSSHKFISFTELKHL